jgi:uncharacterized coiled-coil protein SlyX
MAEEIKVAILEQKLEDLKDIIVKIDDAIEKMSEVNSNVTKMLAVHEQRITKQEETDNILYTKIDKLRDKVDRDYDALVCKSTNHRKKSLDGNRCYCLYNIHNEQYSCHRNLDTRTSGIYNGAQEL